MKRGSVEERADLAVLYNTPIHVAKRHVWIQMKGMTLLFVITATLAVIPTVMNLYAKDKILFDTRDGRSAGHRSSAMDYWHCSELWGDVVLQNMSNSSKLHRVPLRAFQCSLGNCNMV